MKKVISRIIPLALFTIVAFNEIQAQENSQESIYGNTHVIDTTSQGKRREIIRTNIYDHHYNFTLIDNKLSELYIDNKKISPDDFATYEPTIQKIRNSIKADESQADKDRAQGAIDRAQGEKDRAQAAKDKEEAANEHLREMDDREAMRSLLNYLVTLDIVKSTKDITSMALTESELTVNGIRQSGELHTKTKTKFSRWPNGVSYGDHQIPGTQTFYSRRSLQMQ